MASYNVTGCCMGLKCYIKDVDRLCRLEYAASSLCVVYGKKILTGMKVWHVLKGAHLIKDNFRFGLYKHWF